MTKIATKLASKGWRLHSGGAIGADKAFEEGAGLNSMIFYPADAGDKELKLASKYHPAWHRCSDYAKKLHGRNTLIILGINFKSPVKFVICWTYGGHIKGGTGMGIKIAKDKGILVFNLGNPVHRKRLEVFIGE